MTWLMLVVGALGTFRGTRMVLQDEILAGFRDWWWAKYPPESTKRGYLLTCPWCLSIWIGAVLAIILALGGTIGLVFVSILAFSALTGIIFELLER